MTNGYDCYQNALAERVNGIIKNEDLIRKPEDIEQAKIIVDESIRARYRFEKSIPTLCSLK